MENISFMFSNFGRFGPFILLLITSYLLWDKPTLFYYYEIGFITNAILNLILKGILKYPRPSEDPKEFDLAIKNGKRFIFKNGIPHDIFGMPSGHSQSSMFTTAFIFLAIKNTKITLIFLIMTLLIMYQRIKDNHHTFIQVFTGAIIGILYAYLFYYFSQQSIMGKLQEKPDDNGPL